MNNVSKNMTGERPPTIDVVSREVYEKLRVAANQKNQSLRTFVNEILTNSTETEPILKKIFHTLEIVSSSNNAIFVNDSALNQVFTINARKEGLTCNTCNHNEMCNHIAFTLTRPDLLLKLKESLNDDR